MTTVQRWTGREVRALRHALRLTIVDFATRLGVRDRTVSKWEAGGLTAALRPDTQAMLDTALKQAPEDARVRFSASLGETEESAPSVAPIPPSGEISSTVGTVQHPVDRKEMVLVEEGPYLAGPRNEQLSLRSFYIDVTPVTNAEYARFAELTGHRMPAHWIGGNCPAGTENHPVVYVDHGDASAYATWSGKLLPSAGEWEKAARGPHGEIYPWGNQPTFAKCNVRETRVGTTTPVIRYHSGVSPYGVYDMCGNVWEWCRTETSPGRFVLKGSAFTSSISRATPAAMNDASALMLDDDTGFRCVTYDLAGNVDSGTS